MKNFLREYRKAAHMTQSELAKASGTSQVMVCRYENGQRVPKLPAARKIAQALGCQVEDIWPVDNKANQE